MEEDEDIENDQDEDYLRTARAAWRNTAHQIQQDNRRKARKQMLHPLNEEQQKQQKRKQLAAQQEMLLQRKQIKAHWHKFDPPQPKPQAPATNSRDYYTKQFSEKDYEMPQFEAQGHMAEVPTTTKRKETVRMLVMTSSLEHCVKQKSMTMKLPHGTATIKMMRGLLIVCITHQKTGHEYIY